MSQRRSEKNSILNNLRQTGRTTLPGRPWRPLLELYEQKCWDATDAETIFNGAIKDTLEKTERARETGKDGDHDGGVSGDHGSRLRQDAPRSPRRNTETPERARSAADSPKHRHWLHTVKNFAAQKKEKEEETSMRALSSTHDARGCLSSSISGEFESEEWWFDVRPKGVGKKRPRPIDELCSGTSRFGQRSRCNVGMMVRNIRDQCGLVTVGPSARMIKPLKKQSLDQMDPEYRVATRCTEEKLTAALVPSAEAGAVTAVTVWFGTQETLVMLEAVC